MAMIVRGKNIEVTQALKEYVVKHENKITRYFEKEMDVNVLLAVEKDRKIVEVTARVEGVVLRCVEANPDMYAAIDLVFDKLVRQIHKYKTKLAKRFKEVEFKGDLIPAKEAVDEVFEVVRKKRFVARPMDVEEAILQMNLVGHDFFVFRNAETDSINVVYKRKHGKYGLIEPEN